VAATSVEPTGWDQKTQEGARSDPPPAYCFAADATAQTLRMLACRRDSAPTWYRRIKPPRPVCRQLCIVVTVGGLVLSPSAKP
jgi:hypothetical protein